MGSYLMKLFLLTNFEWHTKEGLMLLILTWERSVNWELSSVGNVKNHSLLMTLFTSLIVVEEMATFQDNALRDALNQAARWACWQQSVLPDGATTLSERITNSPISPSKTGKQALICVLSSNSFNSGAGRAEKQLTLLVTE